MKFWTVLTQIWSIYILCKTFYLFFLLFEGFRKQCCKQRGLLFRLLSHDDRSKGCIKMMKFWYSIQVCQRVFKNHDRPIPVTFLKFGWAKIRSVKLHIQDSMIKLCTKNYISRRVRRFVSTLSQLFHFWKALQWVSSRDIQVKKNGGEASFEVKKFDFKAMFCLAQL